MQHKMHLNHGPFKLIKQGTKTIELRLNDEKRQVLKENDLIEFADEKTNESVTVKILALHKYKNFEELYKNFDKISMGYAEEDIADPKDMEKYYSLEEQEQNGVLGIEIKVLNL